MTIRNALLTLLLSFAGFIHGQEPLAPPVKPEPAKVDLNALKLKAGDELELRVFGHDNLTKTLKLPGNGEASFELIGPQKLGGLTTKEASDVITKAYAGGFLKNPVVTLTLLKAADDTVTVMGAVSMPKEIVIPRGNPLDLAGAIAQAGGLNATADARKITLRRKGEKPKLYNFDQLKKAGAKQIFLQDGDRIDVGFNANANQTVTIIGSVTRAGAYPYPLHGKMDIETLIGLGQGVTAQGDKKRVFITRGGKKFSPNNGMRTLLLPNDVVTVPVNPNVGKFVTMSGRVTKPGPIGIPMDGNLTVQMAVARAGGPARLGDIRKISVVRKGQKFKVNLKRIQEGKEKDFRLRAGDTVTIGERRF